MSGQTFSPMCIRPKKETHAIARKREVSWSVVGERRKEMVMISSWEMVHLRKVGEARSLVHPVKVHVTMFEWQVSQTKG